MNIKYKRQDTIFAAILVTLIIIAYILVIIVFVDKRFNTEHFFGSNSQEIVGVWAVISAILIFGTILNILYKNSIICDQYEKTNEFIIYEYEYWCKHSVDYKKLYIVNIVTTQTVFFYNKFLKSYIKDSIPNPEKYINDIFYKNYPNTYPGYTSEQSAMNFIYDYVKSIINKEKNTEGINIRSVKICKTYTLDEIKQIAYEKK